MKPSEIRDELLSQHESIRGHVVAARLATIRWSLGEVPWSHVHDELSALLEALRAHNLLEERALRELIRSGDGWGPMREKIMDDAHVSEHREIHDALVRMRTVHPASEATREFEAFAMRLFGHMAWEEKSFLNAEVLRDDRVPVDGRGD